MASKIVVFACLFAACNAVPIWYNDVLPGTIVRVGRAPSISYGFGSGFSSNVGGLSQSTGIGASFNSGDGVAYGSGIGSSNGGFSRGVGIASSGNSYPVYQAYPSYNSPRTSYGNAVASSQNFGGYNSAVSSANAAGGQALSSAQNLRGLGYESAISSANNGFGSASSAASHNGFGNSNSISSARIAGLGYNSQAVSASEQHGPYRASSAQTVQQRGHALQHSGATSINGPGIQAAHSHAVQTGFY
ncbi:unnamed protein product [Arctia plantaginis]|uniref:Fibroin heavy chain-like n=1 Tax=Arctia plantaginis TaxID=874455 RepID=A0A8S1A5B1_ARCPL|nr:unnamed protein product [Arctia plantaginis]CAB3240187.1 unnamed protein product [Arctia plantaginis]